VEFQEFLWVLRSKTKRVEANITREVVCLEDTSASENVTRVGPSLEGTVELEGTDDDGKKLKESRADGADLIQVTNGRSNVLVSGLKERVELDGFFGDEHAEGTQHGNTSMLQLSLTVLLDSLEVFLGVSKGIELRNRVQRSRKSVSEFSGVRGEGRGDWRSEGGHSSGKRKGGKDELHVKILEESRMIAFQIAFK
jgi:hypothetical protein